MTTLYRGIKARDVIVRRCGPLLFERPSPSGPCYTTAVLILHSTGLFYFVHRAGSLDVGGELPLATLRTHEIQSLPLFPDAPAALFSSLTLIPAQHDAPLTFYSPNHAEVVAWHNALNAAAMRLVPHAAPVLRKRTLSSSRSAPGD